jgi:hypothetical protein
VSHSSGTNVVAPISHDDELVQGILMGHNPYRGDGRALIPKLAATCSASPGVFRTVGLTGRAPRRIHNIARRGLRHLRSDLDLMGV